MDILSAFQRRWRRTNPLWSQDNTIHIKKNRCSQHCTRYNSITAVICSGTLQHAQWVEFSAPSQPAGCRFIFRLFVLGLAWFMRQGSIWHPSGGPVDTFSQGTNNKTPDKGLIRTNKLPLHHFLRCVWSNVTEKKTKCKISVNMIAPQQLLKRQLKRMD